MKILVIIFLVLALIAQVSITTFPFMLLILLCLMVVYQEDWIFLLAFIFGLLFDLVLFKPLGMSSVFYLSILFLILLYQRKFEIATGYFVAIASFLSSMIYLLVFGYNNVLLQSILASVFSIIVFKIIQKSKLKIK
jgi:rod shape-determining protein MreD